MTPPETSETITDRPLFEALVRKLTGFAVFAISLDEQILSWSEGVRDLLGYEEDEFRGLSFPQLFTKEDQAQDQPRTEMQQARSQGSATARRCYLRKDGSKVFVDAVLKATTDATGRVTGYASVMRDLSDEASVTARLSEAFEYVSSIVDTVREAMLVLDPDFRVVSANESFYRLFRESKRQTEGKLIYELGNGQWNIPDFRALLEQILSRRWSVSHYVVNHEFPAIGPRTILLNARWLRRAASAAGLILLAIEDVTEREEAQRLANLNRAWLQATLLSIGDGVITTDKEADIVSLNPVAETLTGWKTSDARGMPLTSVFQIVNEKTRQEMPNPALRALKEDKVVSFANHTILLDKQGREHAIDDSAAPIRTAEGEVSGAVLIFRDITERRKLELEQQRLAEQHNALLQSTAEGIYTIDTQGRCTLINDGALRMLRLKREECLGQNMHALIHHHRANGAEYPEADCPIYRAVFRGAPLETDTEVFWRPDGSCFPVHLSSAPIETDGQRAGAVIAFSDETLRRNLQAEAAENANRLRLAMEASRIVTWNWRPETSTISTSPNLLEIYGVPAIESMEMGMELVFEEDRERHIATVASAAREGRAYSSEFRIRRPDTGEIVWLEERAVFTGGNPHSPSEKQLTGITVDISDKRRIQEELNKAHADLQAKAQELIRSNEDLSQFASIAGHDLQTPLRVMSSYAQLLERRYKDRLDAEAGEYIGFMVRAARDMRSLILGLLDYAQVGGQLEDVVNLQSAVDEVLGLLEPTVQEAEAAIDVGLLPTVRGNQVQLRQLFQNLLVNALKYRHPQRAPRIEVTASRQGPLIEFAVKDNGQGIAARYFQEIFRPLRRLHGSDVPGTGLGLAVCRRIVENHGGTIRVESALDQGSTFLFTLPSEEMGAER